VLYVGIMLTPAGPRVLEFNVRFGDPEAQAVLPLLASNASELFLAIAEGRLGEADVSWHAAHTACVVMAAPGYPDAPVAGVKVRPPAELRAGVHVFKGGLRSGDAPGEFTTTGGRVLSVVAVAPTAEEARAAAYAGVAATSFPGAQFRTDIGL
jgi:phosphoribosylamine--glycine ligase